MSEAVMVFILPAKFQNRRLEDMKASMTKKGLPFTNILSEDVTHIVSEFDKLEQVERQINKSGNVIPGSAIVVSTKWLTECLKKSSIVEVEGSHILQRAKQEIPHQRKEDLSSFPEWACQRPVKLHHLNKKLTSALELLQEHAELRDGDHDYSRALAFRRASCVLKALPFEVQTVLQLRGYKDLGEHAKNIISDILDNGSSAEVDSIVNSSWFKKMKIFTSIFGVGPSTAKAWIDRGWESLEDVCKDGCPSKDWRISWGLAFSKDLNYPVHRVEADNFYDIVKQEAESILPGVIVTLVGGFRRGKATGHDVDILLSHPTEGSEEGMLSKLLSALSEKQLLLVGHKERSTFRSDVLHQNFKLSARGQLDHFEKWLGICKFPKSIYAKHSASAHEEKKTFIQTQNRVNDTSIKNQINNETLSNSGDAKDEINNETNGQKNHIFASSDSSYEPKVKKAKVLDIYSETSSQIKNSTQSLDNSYEPKVKKALNLDNEPQELAASTRTWLARRVDLIVAPYSQYYYALVGWTGSKHFNRDARLYAQKKFNLKLTSHGLFDTMKHEAISASSEEEVFAHLKLPVLDPSERNC